MKYSALAAFLLLAAGVALLSSCRTVDTAVNYASRFVAVYCERLDGEDRAYVRQEFNERSVHKVKVICAGDGIELP